MRTKRTNARNFLLDFIVTCLAILVSISFIHHRTSTKKQEIKKGLITADIKFLEAEIALVQNTIKQTLVGLTEKNRAAAGLQSGLEEKNYRATDSISMVVAQFDPQVIFRPELIGFEAFIAGNELKRLKPLSVRKSLLKSVALLRKANAEYQTDITNLVSTYNELIDGQFNADKSRLINRYFLYNGKIANWLAVYQRQVNMEIQQLKRLEQAFMQLSDNLSSINVNEDEEEVLTD